MDCMFDVRTDEMLIEEVRKYRVLYDRRTALYKDRNARAKTWMMVGQAIGKPADSCEKRWHILREKAVRIFRQRKLRSDSAYVEEEKWPLFQHLLFLQEHVKHRNTARCILPSHESFDSTQASEGLEFEIFEDSSTPSNSRDATDGTEEALYPNCTISEEHPSEGETGTNKKEKINPVDMAFIELMKNHSSASKQDEEHHFGMFVAASLRRLPVRKQDEIKLKIVQLLTDAHLQCPD